MAETQSSPALSVTTPALPKGGGTMQGMGETLGLIGSAGGSSLTVPLPISAGRGYAPLMALHYRSEAGNSIFGLGWSTDRMMISRSISTGVPTYDENDSFIGPDGEVLVAECDVSGKVITRTVSEYGPAKLEDSFRVTRYLPRVERGFDRIERWQPTSNTPVGPTEFWLIHSSDGTLHFLGRTSSARIADPTDPRLRVAEWLIEESLSPTGEHIYYQYQDTTALRTGDARDHVSNRYLSVVYYANRIAAADLYLWKKDADPAKQDWHCRLVFDYGERGTDPLSVPAFVVNAQQRPLLRPDALSHYGYGFEVRTHLLCRQVLMYHQFTEQLGTQPVLVSRLLLEYDENPVASRLEAIWQMAYEPGSVTPVSLPPLELDYAPFTPPGPTPEWKPFASSPGVDLAPYQLVDLYGEGLPGILYQVASEWRYHEPVRDDTAPDPDAVRYTDWETLPFSPALLAGNCALVDVDGDGRLEWMVAEPGKPTGYYRMNADRSWSKFIPFGALPVEFLHSQATHADLHGGGLSDLAMIGPKSVRFYVNQRGGYGRAQNVVQEAGVQLPVRGRDATELVAFSDVLGSGQQHLISVRHDRLVCWPNLGNGRFGTPVSFALPFEETEFNPHRIYLADVDGSGAVDLLYAQKEQILLLRNHAGNGFAAPVGLALPDGLHFTDLDQLSFADVSGQGTVSLILSRFYSNSLVPRFWRYDFAPEKPYLLKKIENNLGAQTTLNYRSSAQEWLDEKQGLVARGLKPVSGVPFPIHLVVDTKSVDELTGNSFTSSYRFRNGYYDGRNREFRGFGYVEATNRPRDEQRLPGDPAFSPPQQIRSWYHCGREEDEAALYGVPFADTAAFKDSATRLTELSASGSDVELAATTEQKWWLYRALNGHPLRQEIYGLDEDVNSAIPYSVETQRYQVRLVQDKSPDMQSAAAAYPIVLPLQIEQIGYNYQRVVQDPLISQSLQLAYDQFAVPTWTVTVSYPRRLQTPSENPYSRTALPAQCWPETFDAQQTVLRLEETWTSPLHQPLPQAWLLNIAHETRQNVVEYAAESGSASAALRGLHVEDLLVTSSHPGLLGPSSPRQFLGQSVVHYKADTGLPQTLRLVDCVETAVLDQKALAAYAGLAADLRQQLLTAGGYQRGEYILEFSGVKTPGELWTARQGFSEYLGQEGFFKPNRQWSSALNPDGTSFTYDASYVCLVSAEEAYQNRVLAQNDYRFLTPWQITDINGNQSQVQYDALGRIVATSFFGSELKEPGTRSSVTVAVGFASLKIKPVMPGLTVSDAISGALSGAKQQQASIMVFDAFSWMGTLSQKDIEAATGKRTAKAIWQRLLELKFISWSGALRSRARHWMNNGGHTDGVPDLMRERMQSVVRLPVHALMLTADDYPEEQQQIQISLSYSDGFGRALQSVIRVPAGLSYQRLSSGELKVNAQNTPEETMADPCWAVSGRVEYNNSGGIIRAYQPYFVNDWRYVADRAMRAAGYADTHYYDAVGREIRIVTAKDWQKRTTFTPWFVVVEDENDTWHEVAGAG